MDDLEEIHRSSKALMDDIMATHQETTDCLCALRFLLRAGSPENGVFINGIEKILIHQESLRCIATSYHIAVGESIKKKGDKYAREC